MSTQISTYRNIYKVIGDLRCENIPYYHLVGGREQCRNLKKIYYGINNLFNYLRNSRKFNF